MDRETKRLVADVLETLEPIRNGTAPDLTSAPTIEHWRVFRQDDLAVLVGFVVGHPHVPDGHIVRTSTLVAIDVDRRWARTLNRFYTLGDPHDDCGLDDD